MTIAADAENPTQEKRQWKAHAAVRLATVGDQMLVALANFALTVSVGRAFGAEEVAAYGIGLSAGLMIQALQRHAIIIPLMLRAPARVLRRRGGIFAQHCMVLAAGVACGLSGLVLEELTDLPRFGCLIIAASAVSLLVYAELEFARAILVKLGRPFLLFGSSVWYAVVAAALSVASLHGLVSFDTVLAVLAAAMVVHALTLFTLAERFSMRLGLHLMASDARRYGGWALIATLTWSGYNHLPLFVLGAMAPPIHAAAFVATRSLSLQPLQILLRGLDIADKAMFAKCGNAPHSLAALQVTMKIAGVYAVAAGLFGGVASFFASDLVHLAYGDKFASSAPALLAWMPVSILISVALPFESLVYARQVFRSYYLVRAIGSIFAVALTVPLVAWGEIGAIAACGAGSLLAVTGTLLILLRGRRDDSR